MKKVLNNKLTLAKQTIAVLTSSDLVMAAGGRRAETQETQCAGSGCTGTHPTQLGLC